MDQKQREFKVIAAGSSRPVKWVLIERAFDATPIRTEFGKLKPLLAPTARFWWRDPSTAVNHSSDSASPWVNLSLDEYKRRNSGREPGCGTLDLLAQTARCTWLVETSLRTDAEPFFELHKKRIAMPPCYVSGTTASAMFSALAASLPSLDWKSMESLAASVPLVVLALAGDGCSANIRLKIAVWAILQKHNERVRDSGASTGVLILADTLCASHVLHNIISRQFAYHMLIPMLHATPFLSTLHQTQRMIWKCLREVIAEDLSTDFFIGSCPPARCRSHAEVCLAMTIRRPETARGRKDEEGPAANQAFMEDMCESLLDVANGDWRSPHVQHYCYKAKQT